MATIINKQTLIDKSNSNIVAVTGVAAFIIIFCLVASKSLISQELYQNRVIDQKKIALNQLKANITAVNQLTTSYKNFVNSSTNIINGNATGAGSQDGNNAKIVLDALPSDYDFPALTTTLSNLISGQGLKINGITGIDEQITQETVNASGNPQPVAMPFTITTEGNYTQIQALINEFENSIRPIQILSMQLTGNQNDMTANISAQTYYQPSKTLNISEEVVK